MAVPYYCLMIRGSDLPQRQIIVYEQLGWSMACWYREKSRGWNVMALTLNTHIETHDNYIVRLIFIFWQKSQRLTKITCLDVSRPVLSSFMKRRLQNFTACCTVMLCFSFLLCLVKFLLHVATIIQLWIYKINPVLVFVIIIRSCRHLYPEELAKIRNLRQQLVSGARSANAVPAQTIPIIEFDIDYRFPISIIEQARPAVTVDGSWRRRGAPWRTPREIIDKLVCQFAKLEMRVIDKFRTIT